ncbi:hypothetical protein QQ045_007710 [Rhodiola kirilowii]
MAVEELVILSLFRLYNDTDMGPFEYPSTTTIAEIKQRIFEDWPVDTEMAPQSVDEFKLINAGRILDSSWTIGQIIIPLMDPEKEVIIIHVVLQPFTGKHKPERNDPKCACACSIMVSVRRGAVKTASREEIEMAPKKGGKVVAPAKKKQEKVVNPLFEKRPKQFGIGGALPPKRDLTRYVKFPKTVQIQRKKRILKQRLKVPPALNQFIKTLDKNTATTLLRMLLKYRPEDKAAKKERLLKTAQSEADGKPIEAKKPIVVKYGLNHVTYLIEQKKAQLVIIAHDVDPIELVVWLPALCKKMEIPYCIVKGKARLGAIVHKKTASVLCLTTVKNEDKVEFSRVLEAIKVSHSLNISRCIEKYALYSSLFAFQANFNDKYEEFRKKWGGGIMGSKSQAKTKAKERLLAKEAAQRMT